MTESTGRKPDSKKFRIVIRKQDASQLQLKIKNLFNDFI